MKIASVIFVIFLIFSSCAMQNKTVMLASGRYVTEKTYHKMLNNAMKSAEKSARKACGISKKQAKSFDREINVSSNLK